MTLSFECEKGHTCFTWNCKDCNNKLAKIVWEINRVGNLKAR